MRGLGTTTLLRALALAAVASAILRAGPALAADPEPWPPTTAPGAGDPGQPPAPVEVSPIPRAVVPDDPPAKTSPPPPREDAPPTTETAERTSVEAVAPRPAPDAGVVAVGAPPRRRSGVEVGSNDGQFFLRTPGRGIVLLPSARLEVNGYSLATPDPFATGQVLSVDRVRFDLAGWLGSKVYFDLSADVAYAFSLRHADDFVAVAPWEDRAILQVGQFDAPFTLENRTPDRYLDFFDRGAAVRAFAIPENKDQGVMLHGTNPARNFYYSAAALNGEGPDVGGASGHVDVMARAWVAPFSFRRPGVLRGVTLGGSAWTGARSGEAFEAQSTPGGYAFLTPVIWWTSGRMDSPVLRQQGRFEAGALELDAPIGHRIGARFEWIAKRQALGAFDRARAAQPAVGGLTLSGWAGYAELWGWVLGSDRLLGAVAAPGLQLPTRDSDFGDVRARGGLMLAVRVDHIEETLTNGADAMSAGIDAGSRGQTRLTAYTAGGSYWFTRRARLMVNYVFNRFEGVTPWLNGLGGKQEHEVLGRLALAL